MDVLTVNNFGDTRSGGLAGPMGLFLIVLMCVATVLLIRNMNKRIRRLPDSFPTGAERDRVAGAARSDADAGRSEATASADLENNRSTQAAAPVDGEAGVIGDGKRDAAPGGGATRE